MKILAIETATEACSAALDIDDSCLQRFEITPRKHTQLILPMIDALLQEAGIKINDLDAIAFGRGPGAFTGLRIAISVTQGLAFAHDLPVIPISTMAALAQHFANDYEYVATAIDARMQEIYWGCYKINDVGLMQPLIEEKVCLLNNLSFITKNNYFGAGSGWKIYSEELKSKFTDNLIGFDSDIFPSAKNLMTLAKFEYMENKAISVEKATPVYLRNKI